MDTFTLYDNEKKQIVDDEITVDQFVDYYLADIEDFDTCPEKHLRRCRLARLRGLSKLNNFSYKNFEFSKN